MAMGSTSAQTDEGDLCTIPKELKDVPPLTLNVSPRDTEQWPKRLEQEYVALISFVKMNKVKNTDWFQIDSNEDGTQWFGICWYIHNHAKYEFNFNFSIPATYPSTAPEILLPQLEGKTIKMYRGGKICLTEHFYPLWSKHVPSFGIVHVLALGLAPWLATEIPHLVQCGRLNQI